LDQLLVGRGLAESRAALLAEAKEIDQAGSALQMTFGFVRPEVPAESPAQRLEESLTPWTTYLILPLFALANAGVAINPDSVEFDINMIWCCALGVEYNGIQPRNRTSDCGTFPM